MICSRRKPPNVVPVRRSSDGCSSNIATPPLPDCSHLSFGAHRHIYEYDCLLREHMTAKQASHLQYRLHMENRGEPQRQPQVACGGEAARDERPARVEFAPNDARPIVNP